MAGLDPATQQASVREPIWRRSLMHFPSQAGDRTKDSLAAPTLAFARAGSCGGWVAGSEAGHGEIWYNGWAAAIERVSDTNSHGDGVVGPTL